MPGGSAGKTSSPEKRLAIRRTSSARRYRWATPTGAVAGLLPSDPVQPSQEHPRPLLCDRETPGEVPDEVHQISLDQLALVVGEPGPDPAASPAAQIARSG
jgi:hypothetical protein